MNRSRREIKTPKRFDEEPFEGPRENTTPQVKQPATPTVVEAPKISRSVFKVSLPRKQKPQKKLRLSKEPLTPEDLSPVEDLQPPEPLKTPEEVSFPDEPPPPPPALKEPRPIKEPKTPREPKAPKEPAPARERRVSKNPPPVKESRPPQEYKPQIEYRLPKEYRPPKEHRLLPAYEDVIPNVVLPFWDARTAAEDHEDDNVKELVHCQCSIAEELGLMVQCETCLTWQHGHCLGIEKDADAPDGYTCQACCNPKFARESMRWAYDQEWLLKGRMKQFFCDPNPLDEKEIELMNKVNRLIDETLKIYKLIHSLRVKARLLSTAADDDPELKLFRVQWPATHQPGVSIQPIVSNNEATPEDCRTNLRQHIKHIEDHINSELTRIEEQVKTLDSDPIRDESDKPKISFEALRSDLQIIRSHIAKTSCPEALS